MRILPALLTYTSPINLTSALITQSSVVFDDGVLLTNDLDMLTYVNKLVSHPFAKMPYQKLSSQPTNQCSKVIRKLLCGIMCNIQ